MRKNISLVIIGCDPGVTGCLSVLDINTGSVQFYDMPVKRYASQSVKNGKVIDDDAALYLVRQLAGPHVAFFIIEYQQAFYKGTRSSTFKIGDCFGLLRGLIRSTNLGLETVKPREWKKNFDLIKTDEMSQNQIKELSRQKALELFPSAHDSLRRKMDHNRAESLLIAEYGRKQLLRKYISGYKYAQFHRACKPISD